MWLLHTDYCTNPFLTRTLTHTAMRWTVLLTLALLPPSPPSPIAKIPLQEIAQRLADSLYPEELFPGTDYLRNVKTELRKLMKSKVTGFSHVCPIVTAFHGLSLSQHGDLESYSFLHTQTH